MAHTKTSQTSTPSSSALNENQQSLRKLVEALPDAILVHRDETIVFVNPFCVRLHGAQRPEQLLGKRISEFIHPDDLPIIRSRISDSYATGMASTAMEHRLVACDGSLVEIEAVAVPITWEGSPALQVVLRDIRKRKRTEQALRESEQKYRKLFENAIYGIFRSQPDGTLLDVNPALVRILGYSSTEELLAMNLSRDIYESPAAREAILERYRPGGRIDGVEVKWRRKDGELIMVRISGGQVCGQDGQVSHYEVIAEDITERRKLEEQFHHAQKMEALGLLAGGISHEFNNLLAVILGNTELLVDASLSDVQRHYLEGTKRATSRAAELTRQLLTFSVKQVLHPTVLDLNAILRDVAKILQRVIGEDIRVVTDFAPGLGSIHADRGQIEQILMNLATNARDAMRHGGTLTIRTENAELGADAVAQYPYVKPGRYVHLSVHDTGTGMCETERLRAFEPFFTTKPPGWGTGLGLATVYGIVKQSHGYIWIASTPGVGSTFDIYLPREERAPLALPNLELESKYPRATETILLLEDDPTLRQLTCAFLRAGGYNVLQAESGNHAIDLARQYEGAIALLVSDIVLPDMDGPAAVSEIRALHPEAKILYTSGYADVPAAKQVLSEGALLLQKPVPRSELLGKVDDMLHRVESGPQG